MIMMIISIKTNNGNIKVFWPNIYLNQSYNNDDHIKYLKIFTENYYYYKPFCQDLFVRSKWIWFDWFLWIWLHFFYYLIYSWWSVLIYGCEFFLFIIQFLAIGSNQLIGIQISFFRQQTKIKLSQLFEMIDLLIRCLIWKTCRFAEWWRKKNFFIRTICTAWCITDFEFRQYLTYNQSLMNGIFIWFNDNQVVC